MLEFSFKYERLKLNIKLRNILFLLLFTPIIIIGVWMTFFNNLKSDTTRSQYVSTFKLPPAEQTSCKSSKCSKAKALASILTNKN
jgi:hypothetical protein